MDSSKTLDDFFRYEASLNYFNIEIPRDGSAFVINASKRGIDSFLERYSDPIPKVIHLDNWSRPYRKWESHSLNELYKLTNTWSPRVDLLWVENELHIQLVEEDHQPLLCVGGCRDVPLGYEGYPPTLTVNRKGWQKFLDALRYLRDENFWFYIPSPSLNPGLQLRFELSEPYKGNRWDHVFPCIEMIRLEPYEEISLEIEDIEPPDFSSFIIGNCSGELLLCYWLYSFAEDQEKEREIINYWTRFSHRRDEPSPDPTTLVFHRIEDERFRYPSFSIQCKEERKVTHIFGNSSGFQEFGIAIENFAFRKDHEKWILESTTGKSPPFLGSLSKEILPTENFYRAKWWGINGGGGYDKRYNPIMGCYFPKDENSRQNFIKARLPQ